MATFDVYIINSLSSAAEVSLAASKLAERFKLPEAQSKQLIEKQRALIKRGVDDVTANKIASAIQHCGLGSEIVEVTDSAELELVSDGGDAKSELQGEGEEGLASNIYQAPTAAVGKQVFCRQCGNQMPAEQRVCGKCGASHVVGAGRSKVAAGFLAFFLGGFGVHRFYLGQWWGIFYIPLFFVLFSSVLIGIIEAVYFWVCSNEGWDKKYGHKPAGSGAVIAVVVGVAIVPIIGILAAIALPAYQDYTVRAKASEGIAEASVWKLDVVEFAVSTNFIPNSALDAGIERKASGQYVQSIDIVEGGEIHLTYKPLLTTSENYTVIFRPTFERKDGRIVSAEWDCTGGTLLNRYRPQRCRGAQQQATPSLVSSSGFKMVSSPYTGLQLSVPAKWKENVAESEEASLNYGNIYSEEYLLLFEEVDEDGVFSGLDEFHQLVQQMYMESLTGAALTAEGTLTTNSNAQGKYSRIKATVEGHDIVYIVVVFNQGNEYYQLMLWTLESRAACNEKTLKQIAKSVVLP